MIERGTPRLVVALCVSLVGAVGALFAGSIEIALLVTPWAVLLTLGLGDRTRPEPQISIRADPDRTLERDEVAITAEIVGVVGSVHASLHGVPGTARTPVTTVARSGRASAGWLVDDLPWGVHDVGRLDVEVTEPYGLVSWSGAFDQPTIVRVHPDTGVVRELLGPHLVRRTLGSHRSTAIDRGVEFADLRQYQAGDSVRDINWSVSARSEELWVSERHGDRATDVVLLLDTFVGSGHDAHQLFRMAVEATMGIAEHHVAASDRVGVVELGGVIRWVDARPGRLHLHRLVDSLLAIRQYENAAQMSLAMIPARALPPRSFVIALSPLTDTRFTDALVVLAARGHDVAVISCPPAGTPVEVDGPAMRISRRLQDAERQLLRDHLIARGIATAEWRRGDDIDVALLQLDRIRRHVRRSGFR